MRMGLAYQMLLGHISANAVFKKNFNSAEGWYSQVVFNTKGLAVKIVGRGFDDFFREPVVLYNGRLYRCQLKQSISSCYSTVVSKASNGSITVYDLPAPKVDTISRL
jgi:hypothetical protein